MELALFLGLSYLLTALAGLLFERLRVPWLFAALLLGIGLAAWNPLHAAATSAQFRFLAELGMYFFLFVVGFEMNLAEMRKEGRFILVAAAVIILLESVVGSVFIHLVFGTGWVVAAVVGLSFATVGEAVLVPILDEFGMLQTRLGQTILGIGLVDDVFEVLTVVALAVLLASGGAAAAGASHGALERATSSLTLAGSAAAIAGLFVATWLLRRVPGERVMAALEAAHVTRPKEVAFALSLVVLFAFVWLGSWGAAGPLGALLAGLAVKPLVPVEVEAGVADDVQIVSYGLFGPLFFLSVGLETDPGYLVTVPLVILGLMLLVNATKVAGSLLVGWKKLGGRDALVMGMALSVKFSTSLVIIKLLMEAGQISRHLFSVLVATKILFKFAVPLALAALLRGRGRGRDAVSEA